jgi:hypothetical protein
MEDIALINDGIGVVDMFGETMRLEVLGWYGKVGS